MKSKLSFLPFDWIILVYCGLMLLMIAAFGRPLGGYIDEALFYASVIGLTALIVRYANRSDNRRHMFIRLLYPGILFTFFYRATGGMMFLLHDGFFDWQLTTFEHMVFGVNPTIYIDRHWLNPFLNELFSAAYGSYYPMVAGLLLPVFFKRDDHVLKQANTALCLTFFISYILFFLYPVEGPRWFFAGDYLHTIDGSIFRGFVEFVIAEGAVRGGCMPSSHVAVALVVMMFCLRYYRVIGWVLVPFNIGLAIGTFWGRFHYVTDVFVGAIIGVTVTLLVWRYYRPGASRGKPSSNRKQQEFEHAS